jgi:hypothetical protein
MAETEASTAFYSDVTDFLQQGDLFKVNIVVPFADQSQRLFRATDGRHGSVVFAETVTGTVYESDDLRAVLAQIPNRTPLHTEPFQSTPDGQRELVLVFGGLAEFFLIATQTCDVSAHDKPPHPYAIILTAKTIINICRFDRVPFQGEQTSQTIEDYLVSATKSDALRRVTDPNEYFSTLKKEVSNWKPQGHDATVNCGRIKNFIRKQTGGAQHVHFLPADSVRGIPDLFVEFSGAYTVDTSLLVALSGRRIARIAVPYREQFAKAFADRIARIAVHPTPKPPSI